MARLVPHGEAGHFETRQCPACHAFLDELEELDGQVLELCALGLAEVVSTDHRGERSYRLTHKGRHWLERQHQLDNAGQQGSESIAEAACSLQQRPMTDAVSSSQLSLFRSEGALTLPGCGYQTPREMPAERLSHAMEADDEPGTDVDDDLSPDQQRSMPREWAPYCADTIAMNGTIRKPASRLGALWVCTGVSGRASERDVRGASVYRVVPLAEYRSPHPDLPLTYHDHNALPSDHPFRWGYEGMLITWQRRPHVLTDEHLVFSHPYVPNPDGYGYLPDPEWYPHDDDAVRSGRSPWWDDPDAWQPTRRLI